MKIWYYIIQIIFTLIGSAGLFAFMFFNNVNLKEVLSDGIATYIILKDSISLGILLFYIVAVTILLISLLWFISKIFKSKRIPYFVIKRVFYYQLIYYLVLVIFLNIFLINSLNNIFMP